LSNKLNGDFNDLIKFLLTNRLITKEWLKKNLNKIKEIHRIIYSFFIWDYHLSDIDECGRFFIHELRSDSVQTMPLVLMGYNKAVALLLRGIVENALKHIYYLDHPIEFQWLTMGTHFLSLDDLTNYVKKYPRLSVIINHTNVLQEIKQIYSETSKYVHAQSIKYMQLVLSLKDIHYDEKFFNWYVIQLRKIGRIINLLMATIHFNKFKLFELTFKKIILKSIKKEYRKLIFE